ncbi:MAG TPA: hypothetical protein VMN36_15045 [Verrucomicrobiales bacterium]|nr:hypothetical protein [Verrucomicrobiales bacterium]
MKASLAPFVAVFSVLTAGWAAGTRLHREEGAIYLEDFLSDPVELRILQTVNAFYTLEGKRYLGTMKPGQVVEVLAISDRAYRVRGVAQQGQVAGWVGPKFLEPVEDEFLDNLRKAAERKKIVDELIAAKEVALGMTIDEVEQSLGKPTRKSSRIDAEGRSDTYDYITYKNVPQYNYYRDGYGRVFRDVYYVKVETGKVSVEFQDGIVGAVAEMEDNQRGGALKVVPAPVGLF